MPNWNADWMTDLHTHRQVISGNKESTDIIHAQWLQTSSSYVRKHKMRRKIKERTQTMNYELSFLLWIILFNCKPFYNPSSASVCSMHLRLVHWDAIFLRIPISTRCGTLSPPVTLSTLCSFLLCWTLCVWECRYGYKEINWKKCVTCYISSCLRKIC